MKYSINGKNVSMESGNIISLEAHFEKILFGKQFDFKTKKFSDGSWKDVLETKEVTDGIKRAKTWISKSGYKAYKYNGKDLVYHGTKPSITNNGPEAQASKLSMKDDLIQIFTLGKPGNEYWVYVFEKNGLSVMPVITKIAKGSGGLNGNKGVYIQLFFLYSNIDKTCHSKALTPRYKLGD